MMHSGQVKIFTDDIQTPIYTYGHGEYFGNNELFTSIKRLGTAYVTVNTQFYRINKFKLDNIFTEYVDIKKTLVLKAIEGNREFLLKKSNLMAKYMKDPLYGVSHKIIGA